MTLEGLFTQFILSLTVNVDWGELNNYNSGKLLLSSLFRRRKLYCINDNIWRSLTKDEWRERETTTVHMVRDCRLSCSPSCPHLQNSVANEVLGPWIRAEKMRFRNFHNEPIKRVLLDIYYICGFKFRFKETFEFSGPYNEIRPVTLTNHRPRTKGEIW